MQNEIEDGVQEVFVACFRSGGVLSRVQGVEKGFRVFLLGVARNTALHMERTRARRAHREQAGIGSHLSTDEESLSRVYDRAYARAVMREAAETMAAQSRETGGDAERRVDLLRLRFEEGMPIREIARLWERTPEELHNEFAKARREFRGALKRVVGLSERCADENLDRECDALLGMLRLGDT